MNFNFHIIDKSMNIFFHRNFNRLIKNKDSLDIWNKPWMENISRMQDIFWLNNIFVIKNKTVSDIQLTNSRWRIGFFLQQLIIVCKILWNFLKICKKQRFLARVWTVLQNLKINCEYLKRYNCYHFIVMEIIHLIHDGLKMQPWNLKSNEKSQTSKYISLTSLAKQ